VCFRRRLQPLQDWFARTVVCALVFLCVRVCTTCDYGESHAVVRICIRLQDSNVSQSVGLINRSSNLATKATLRSATTAAAPPLMLHLKSAAPKALLNEALICSAKGKPSAYGVCKEPQARTNAAKGLEIVAAIAQQALLAAMCCG